MIEHDSIKAQAVLSKAGKQAGGGQRFRDERYARRCSGTRTKAFFLICVCDESHRMAGYTKSV